MFNVYTEMEAFEQIVLFPEKTPNWSKILNYHAQVFLNLSDDELDAEMKQGTTVFEYTLANGGREPIALNDYFELIYDEPLQVIEKPRSAFILRLSPKEATEWQSRFGALVLSQSNIDDLALTKRFRKNLRGNETVSGDWRAVFSLGLPPINSLVVSDGHLFDNDDGNRGTQNFIRLIELALPQSLDCDFHLLLITPEHKLKGTDWGDQKVEELKGKILALERPYTIVFEVVFSETIHPRLAFSNYFNLTTEKGFAIFKTDNPSIVHENTRIDMSYAFSLVNPEEGDTEYSTATVWLKDISAKAKSVAQYLKNRPNDKNKRILGDCNMDKSLKNRLLGDI
jgi:hypothetical protein